MNYAPTRVCWLDASIDEEDVLRSKFLHQQADLLINNVLLETLGSSATGRFIVPTDLSMATF